MRRNKIKQKYLALIDLNKDTNSNNISNTFDKLENKIIKSLISFLWIFLMLVWGAIPVVILVILGIDINALSDSTLVSITLINDILFLMLLILVYYKTLKKDMFKYFLHNLKNNLKTSFVYWLMGLGIMVISNYVIAIVMNGQLAENEEAVRGMIDISPWYMAFQILIYAPISEELIFRKSIRDIFDNKILFACFSGIIFGGLHAISSITSVASLLYLIPYCSLGIAFGFLYAKTDNIFSTIIAHFIHNFLALILYLVAL